MNLLYFTLATIVIFFITLCFYEKKKVWLTIISSIGIAGVVNSNFFTSLGYPIDIFGLNFGIDSIIYTLFMFTIILNYKECGKKSAIIYTISGAAAVFLAGVFEIIAVGLSSGLTVDSWRKFAGFVISALTTIGVGVFSVFLFDIFKKKTKMPDVVNLIVVLFFASITNTALYYGLDSLVLGYEFVAHSLLTSFLGKLISLGCASIVFILMKSIDHKIEKKQTENDR